MGFAAVDLANAARPVRRKACEKTAIAKERCRRDRNDRRELQFARTRRVSDESDMHYFGSADIFLDAEKGLVDPVTCSLPERISAARMRRVSGKLNPTGSLMHVY
jgi:hypothetical protein